MKPRPNQFLSNLAVTLVGGALLAVTGFYGEKCVNKLNSACNAIVRSSYWLDGIAKEFTKMNQPLIHKDLKDIVPGIAGRPMTEEERAFLDKGVNDVLEMSQMNDCFKEATSMKQIDVCAGK